MQKSKQTYPRSHSWYRQSQDSDLHSLGSNTYAYPTVICCLAWDKNLRRQVTCPRSHSKTVLLGLNSTKTPGCILAGTQTSSSPSPFPSGSSPPLLGTSPPQVPLLKAARMKRCLPPHSLLGQMGKKEEGRLGRRRGSHCGSYLHELVIAWFPELLAVSACSLPVGRR